MRKRRRVHPIAQSALMDPGREHLRMYTIVLPEHRLLYTWTPKVACTSMKWLLAEAVGFTGLEEAQPFNSSTAAMTIHDRSRFPFKSLADLNDEALEEALVSNDWMRFCLVRDPFVRCFSAWSHMVLLQEPHMLESFGRAHFDRTTLRSDVAGMFQAFVRQLSSSPERWFRDGHFARQTDIVRSDVIPYTDIVQVRDLPTFEQRLVTHLSTGADLFRGGLKRMNEGISFDYLASYTDDTRREVARIYESDFVEFGYPNSLETTSRPQQVLSDLEISLIGEVRERNDRIFTLVEHGRQVSGRLAALDLGRAIRRRISSRSERIVSFAGRRGSTSHDD